MNRSDRGFSRRVHRESTGYTVVRDYRSSRESELERLVRAQAPQLLKLPGYGPLSAAKLITEVAGVERFADDARLAMLASVAPLDASSGRQQRHRLNRKGNRLVSTTRARSLLIGGPGHDTLIGSTGATIINAADGGERDVVICRSARNRVLVDRRDVVRGPCQIHHL